MPAGNPDAGVQGAWAMAPVWWEHAGTNGSEVILYRGGDHVRLCCGNRERMDTLSAKDRKKKDPIVFIVGGSRWAPLIEQGNESPDLTRCWTWTQQTSPRGAKGMAYPNQSVHA